MRISFRGYVVRVEPGVFGGFFDVTQEVLQGDRVRKVQRPLQSTDHALRVEDGVVGDRFGQLHLAGEEEHQQADGPLQVGFGFHFCRRRWSVF